MNPEQVLSLRAQKQPYNLKLWKCHNLLTSNSTLLDMSHCVCVSKSFYKVEVQLRPEINLPLKLNTERWTHRCVAEKDLHSVPLVTPECQHTQMRDWDVINVCGPSCKVLNAGVGTGKSLERRRSIVCFQDHEPSHWPGLWKTQDPGWSSGGGPRCCSTSPSWVCFVVVQELSCAASWCSPMRHKHGMFCQNKSHFCWSGNSFRFPSVSPHTSHQTAVYLGSEACSCGGGG